MDVEALAHGGASYRSLDDACMLVVERSLDPASESHNFRLDLYCRNRRLRANNFGSLETDYGCARTKNEIMSLQTALHDPVFRAYLWIVLFSLVAGGALLALLKCGFKKEISSMWRTYCSWLIMAPLALLVVFAGRIPTNLGVTLLAIFGFKEFARASGLYRDWWMTGAVYAGIISVGVAALMSHPRGDESGPGWNGLFVAVPVFAIALILLIPILHNRA